MVANPASHCRNVVHIRNWNLSNSDECLEVLILADNGIPLLLKFLRGASNINIIIMWRDRQRTNSQNPFPQIPEKVGNCLHMKRNREDIRSKYADPIFFRDRNEVLGA